MPLSSGKIRTSGDSGKCFSCRLTRPATGRLERRLLRQQRAVSSNSTSWIVSRYDALGFGGIVDRERVERIAVARRVDLRFEDRQAAAAEEAADAREEVLLVGKVDHHLQPAPRARSRALHDRLACRSTRQ